MLYQNAQHSECVIMPSQAVTCGTRVFVLHACPHTLFLIKYSHLRVYFDIFTFPLLANIQTTCSVISLVQHCSACHYFE